MENPIEKTRAAVFNITQALDPESFVLIPTSRNLEAVIDKCFEWQVKAHRWYAVISRGDHIHAVADIDNRRISLQRYILKLHVTTKSYDDLKHISFANKVSFDCRLSNVEGHIGRQAAMRNRRPKSNTSSKYKGVIKAVGTEGTIRWRTQIKGDQGSLSIGVYPDEHWAATVYDAAAYLLFDGAALYNFPDQPPNLAALEIAAARITRHRHKVERKMP